ncbi:hypothetical protein MAXJ12_34389 [Mesorhizobium alhagi CCNWXJ12-2]|uniref:Uncharacterized protein n=1 Tax=Mesorhizobium alhagi CCNWXJ12-2 TaxID=1107882 RepID=H0I318_9HYPH|nr:hypothetical protein MAXJ12_34389 [Mesorhizobium alhagi CCNWXJ12-2]
MTVAHPIATSATMRRGIVPPLSEDSFKGYEFHSKTSTSEANMSTEPDDIRIIRLHKKWADGYTLLSQHLILLLFTGSICCLNSPASGRRNGREHLSCWQQ